MDTFCTNRLLIVGPAKDLRRFPRGEHWMAAAGGRHFELMEHSPSRHAWQFDSDAPPLQWLRTISRKWPFLVFLIDYDCEDQRLKGLAKVRNGRLRHFRVNY